MIICRLIHDHINLVMTQTADIDNTGFPPGYFIIRSVASDKLLDVTWDEIEDGTEIALWPEKEKSLVESQFSFSLVVNNLSLNLKQAFENLQPTTRCVSLDNLQAPKITVNCERLHSGL